MINRCFCLLPFIVLFLTIHPLQAASHALVVGIGDYPTESSWRKTSGKQDAQDISSFLKGQYFTPENIQLLTNKKASKAGILTAFDLLQQQIKAGDIVVFYFSGHGSQFIDCQDEERLNDINEGLVPYDIPPGHGNPNQDDGYIDGKYVLSDDVLNQHFQQIRQRLGANGHLLVIIEACHSGGMLRTAANGQKEPQLLGISCNSGEKMFASNPFELNLGTENRPGLSTMVAMLSSQENQSSFYSEDERNSIFTGLLIQSCRELSQSNTLTSVCYSSVLEKIKKGIGERRKIVRDNQTPRIQEFSPTLNSYLFFGKGLYRIRRDSRELETKVVLPLDISLQLANNEHEDYLKLKWLLPVASGDRLSKATISETIPYPGQHHLLLQQENGDTIWHGISSPLSPQELDALFRPLLINHYKAQTLRDWKTPSTSPLSLQVLVERMDRSYTPPKDEVISVGDIFKVLIENKSDERQYYTLIEVLSTDELKVMLPTTGSDGVTLEAGQKEERSYRMTLPLGVEYLKLITSPNPISKELINAFRHRKTAEEYAQGIESFRELTDCTVAEMRLRVVK